MMVGTSEHNCRKEARNGIELEAHQLIFVYVISHFFDLTLPLLVARVCMP